MSGKNCGSYFGMCGRNIPGKMRIFVGIPWHNHLAGITVSTHSDLLCECILLPEEKKMADATVPYIGDFDGSICEFHVC